ncbi:EAL domain-containing protein [Halomonas sp. MCCC 1A17488]|uniref:putative bifunctional diguanylate cyclase/phosphodiesterase n=1 Tax=unclassified Halomonas TaxID=2609666 RepID=UPI0018D26360|nr:MULTISPECIES: EAL domain-containing protein [unclassified Halomonas]MCE8014815.1 EAL domain-containing protein [Halomonas sp. MCCC 1A17488]MCG3238148.1 EAL domain-containing protein [Halomonas sp. MCCC 1A17488]QPP48084.1 EAL domain-containing protein [Halomonas sp. SS10-MC5]
MQLANAEANIALALAAGLLMLVFPLRDTMGQSEPEHDQLVFAGSATYPPFQWLDRHGQAKGFVIDLQESMAHHAGIDAEHRLMEWDSALQEVQDGRADAIALFAAEERAPFLDFTEPFYYLFHGIFSHDDGEHFSSLAALEGHRAAVVSGSHAEARLAEEHPDIPLVPVATEYDCLRAVQARQAEACIEASLTSMRHAAEMNVRQSSPPFWPQPYVFGVRKGNTAMLAWLEHQLAVVMADGTFNDIYQQWRPELEWRKPNIIDSLRTYAWAVAVLLFMALLGFMFSWYLKRQVSLRTRLLSQELKARSRLEEELRYQAEHDTLTGLPSRTRFIESLDRRLQEQPNWEPTVILLRLLSLEQLTSMFGYRFGHELLLISFARHLESLDFAQVSHLGSGVFAILRQHDFSHDDLAQRVNDSLVVDTISIDVQVAMGICEGRTKRDECNGSEAEELVRRAMTAYSAAAGSGQAWRIYSPDLEPDPNDLILLRDFRRHGTRDMYLLYQPKLDLASGYVRGAEALVRWQHPQLGNVSPAHFIPLLEETGLITRLTYWVMEEAIQAVERCQEHDEDFSLSVNISSRDLMEGSTLIDFIKTRSFAYRKQALCLEITETGVIHDQRHAQKVIEQLHDENISCAVDDFGTGYASLSYLSAFSVDEVKLDRSFISNMLENRRHRTIIASTIALAHELGLKVTAEGVEDAATLRELAGLGCDMAQGYVISKPIAERDLHQLIGHRYFSETLLQEKVSPD